MQLVPDELITAGRERRAVLFAGAGLSMTVVPRICQGGERA
jgi:hypothetical protein